MPSYTGRNKGYSTMARVVIHALGFPSFRHVAAIADVSHHTIADILYKRRRHEFTSKSTIQRVYQVIYTEWQKKKFGFTKSEFTLYETWLNEWRARLLSKALVRRPSRRLPASEMKHKKDVRWRAKREAKRIAELEKALRAFE